MAGIDTMGIRHLGGRFWLDIPLGETESAGQPSAPPSIVSQSRGVSLFVSTASRPQTLIIFEFHYPVNDRARHRVRQTMKNKGVVMGHSKSGDSRVATLHCVDASPFIHPSSERGNERMTFHFGNSTP